MGSMFTKAQLEARSSALASVGLERGGLELIDRSEAMGVAQQVLGPYAMHPRTSRLSRHSKELFVYVEQC